MWMIGVRTPDSAIGASGILPMANSQKPETDTFSTPWLSLMAMEVAARAGRKWITVLISGSSGLQDRGKISSPK